MPFVIQWVDDCEGSVETASINTPAGRLVIALRRGVIYQADWLQEALPDQFSDYHLPGLGEYWLNPDIDVPIKLLKQGSVYRQKVWAELSQIPIGATMTYSELAKKIGSGARAVGNACRDNAYPLFIPCHRVVSASGMGGYAGQTEGDFMTIKRKLLEFEAAYRR